MTMTLDPHRPIHFVGISGIGMSALARLLLAQGYPVSGSDRNPSEQGQALSALGAVVFPTHEATHVNGAQLVVVTSAISDDNSEIREAKIRDIPVLKRAQLLADIFNSRRGIAVAGTHGKTTTSALVGHILTQAGLDPTILIGGISADLDSNCRVGQGELVVAEADEYDGSFLHLRPDTAVITNVEADHLDFYQSVERIHAAFSAFAASVRSTLVVCADDSAALNAARGSGARTLTYGLQHGDWHASDVQECEGRMHFGIHERHQRCDVSTSLAGMHNVRNVLAAVAVARHLQVPLESAAKAIASFQGVARRLERIGEVDKVLILDDYAHHPTEMRTVLHAVRERYQRPIRLVFQPHTFSRTSAFFHEFVDALHGADSIYLMNIYAAREVNTYGVTADSLAVAARDSRLPVTYTPERDDAVAALLRDVRPHDVVLTMGAGDVYEVGRRLLTELQQR